MIYISTNEFILNRKIIKASIINLKNYFHSSIKKDKYFRFFYILILYINI